MSLYYNKRLCHYIHVVIYHFRYINNIIITKSSKS